MPVVQVAMTALDIKTTTAWYRDVLGFLPTGELRGIGGPDTAAFMGLPTCQGDVVWLTDSSDFFQLEFFRFDDPVPAAGSPRPDHAGWSLVGLYIDNLDAVLAALDRAGAPVSPILGDAPARRVCTQDPEGVWIELRERVANGSPCPRAVRDAPVTTAFVRAVVTDLARAHEFFVDSLGLHETSTILHTAADERLWGGPVASLQSCVLATDGDAFLVELVQYPAQDPRSAPPRRICDQGILNIAFGSRVVEDYETVVNQVRSAGFRLYQEMILGTAKAYYVLGPDDLSVELLTIPDVVLERKHGFVPPTYGFTGSG